MSANSTSFLLKWPHQKSMIESYLRVIFESVDTVIKSIAKNCKGENRAMIDSIPSLINYMLNNSCDKFWREYQNAIPLIVQLNLGVTRSLGLSNYIDPDNIQKNIWKIFLRRLSLDEWLIFKLRDHPSSGQNGNLVLNIFMQSILDAIYCKVPPLALSNLDDSKSECLETEDSISTRLGTNIGKKEWSTNGGKPSSGDTTVKKFTSQKGGMAIKLSTRGLELHQNKKKPSKRASKGTKKYQSIKNKSSDDEHDDDESDSESSRESESESSDSKPEIEEGKTKKDE